MASKFKFNIIADIDWESYIDNTLNYLADTGFRRYFLEQDYGSSLNEVVVCLMCQDPDLNLKQRVRLVKKEKILYLDIMLDLNKFRVIDQKERDKIVVEKILTETPEIVKKYKLEDFNLSKFEADLKFYMSKIL